MRTDKMTPRYAIKKSFTARFPGKYEWKDDLKADRK
jgi:hypothetical protein